MRQEPPASRLRGASLFLARSAALLVSIGVVSLVVAKAGVAGCKSSADIAAEASPSGAADSAGGPSGSGAPGAAAGATATHVEDPEVGFMGGSKAPAGNWAFPSKPSGQPAAQTAAPSAPAPNAPPQTAPQTPPQTPTQTPASKPPAKGAPTGALPPPPNAPNLPVDR